MALQQTLVTAVVGLVVAVATFFPLRRTVAALVERRAGLLAAVIAGMLGVAALTAWRQEPWYRYTVLGILGAFVLLYVFLTSVERFSPASS